MRRIIMPAAFVVAMGLALPAAGDDQSSGAAPTAEANSAATADGGEAASPATPAEPKPVAPGAAQSTFSNPFAAPSPPSPLASPSPPTRRLPNGVIVTPSAPREPPGCGEADWDPETLDLGV